MKKVRVLSMLLVLLIMSLASFAQAYTWFTYEGHEYALTNTWTTWQGAQTEAGLWGANLVTIETAGENTWLTSKFADAYGRDTFAGANNPWMAAAWIGLGYADGHWVWASTGEIADYIPSGSFNTGATGVHTYLHVGSHPWPGTWNNDAQHDPLGNFFGIMERVSQVPEPATMLLFGLGLVGLAGVRRFRN